MITVLIVLIVVGVLLYILNTLVPMDSRIKTVIYVLVCLFLFLWILQVLGVWKGLPVFK